jgi:membrane-associated phospholipid phosphatase
MPLKHLLMGVLLSIPTSTLAQEAPPQEPQIGQETDTSQSGQVTENTQVAQDSQSANIQSAQTQKTENPAEPESHGTRLRWQDIPRNVLHDEKAIFTSPFHINRENAKWWILFGGATAALIANDQRISDRLPQTTPLTKPSTWASRIGADYSICPLWATFYLVGKAGDHPKARDTARLGIESLIDADITVNIMKLATQRPRPENKGDSVSFFKGGDAFPSGHSIKIWALARVAAREYSNHKWVPFLAYSAATTVSAARFGGRRHNASDALAGAAMGFFIGDFVYRHHHAPSEKSKIAIWLVDHVNLQFGDPVPVQNNRLYAMQSFRMP